MAMADITFPVYEQDSNKFCVKIELSLYSKEAITATIYKFTDKCYVHQQIDEQNPNIIVAVFEPKDGSKISAELPKQFCNDLIDQQLRVDVNNQFGHIRNLIVEEAFKPANK